MKALIIARGGSERVPRKNLRKLGDTPLLVHKINQLKELGIEIIVSSDDWEILDLAYKTGATAIKRPEYFALGGTPMKEVYSHVAWAMSCESILFANCTSPFVGVKTLKLMMDIWENLDVDSLNTVSQVRDFLWHEFNHKAINYNPENQPRSQDLTGTVRINWAAAIVRRDAMIKEGNVVCKKSHFFHIPDEEALDIDTEADFKLAEIIYANNYRR